MTNQTYDDPDNGQKASLISSGKVARYSIISSSGELFALYRNSVDVMTMSSSGPTNYNKRLIQEGMNKEEAIRFGKELIEKEYQRHLVLQQEEWLN